MRITKFGHACVRVEYDDQAVVLDPGMFTEPEAVDGATAVLITHEHPDHVHVDHLRRTDAPIFTIAAVANQLADDLRERVTVVTPGASLDVGLPVTVVGEKHAVIHPELPHFDNSGYLLHLGEVLVFHPGDALTVPGQDIDVLLLPVSAPWLKISESIDFAREVGAPRNLAIHDAVYSEAGLGIADGHLERFLGARHQSYTRLAAGTDL
ncbi:MBL fold metallo-hydrolase [Nocardioides terrisoli]|uniref:MBL fold metallo-hydrolase n=1 Tax=Nocardioides terrisoli TaxID=3388267 RepID=UPI00287BC608|nr:MBL fold metallo-hydrolase [Nocardioides marmorisolisilvae]